MNYSIADLKDLLSRSINGPVTFGRNLVVANWSLSSQLPWVDRCFHQVRNELAEVGLLYTPTDEDDGGYLDQIELVIQRIPSLGEAGFVYEALPLNGKLMGYREGVIYLPCDLPHEAYVPGGTLIDVIRHEFAHAWHWLEPSFFETGWFERAFGGDYEEVSVTPEKLWRDKLSRSRKFAADCAKTRNPNRKEALEQRYFRDEFVSEYASTLFCEDFAETFMTYLRHRKSLSKFQSRPGVYRKLLAVKKAVAKASRELWGS